MIISWAMFYMIPNFQSLGSGTGGSSQVATFCKDGIRVWTGHSQLSQVDSHLTWPGSSVYHLTALGEILSQ